MSTTRSRALVPPAPEDVDGDHTAIPPIPSNEEEKESPPENPTEDAVTSINEDLENKYQKNAASMFDRKSLAIIEVSVWSERFTWKKTAEDDWGVAPKEDELLSCLRLKLLMSAGMQRVGIRIHETLAKMHKVLISKFLDIMDGAEDIATPSISKKVESVGSDEDLADRTVYTAKEPTSAQIGYLVTNSVTFLFFAGAKATGRDSTSHWRTKIARVHQSTSINGKLHSDILILSIATTRLFLQC